MYTFESRTAMYETPRLASILAVSLLVSCFSASAAAADSRRGKLLYENQCAGCHESVVHVRDNHKMKSADEMRAEVSRWARNQKLEWGSAEIDDVTHYLNERFYHFGPTSD
jgi:mono/diheme cytochrome c family protein